MKGRNHKGTKGHKEAQRRDLEYEPTDAVSEELGLEVQKQTHASLCQTHVRQELGFVNWEKGIYSLEFHDYEVIHE